jgi:hypothetical protein
MQLLEDKLCLLSIFKQAVRQNKMANYSSITDKEGIHCSHLLSNASKKAAEHNVYINTAVSSTVHIRNIIYKILHHGANGKKHWLSVSRISPRFEDHKSLATVNLSISMPAG